MRFATALDMEPGFLFRSADEVLEWLGCRQPTRPNGRNVTVMYRPVTGGRRGRESVMCVDRTARFELVSFEKGARRGA